MRGSLFFNMWCEERKREKLGFLYFKQLHITPPTVHLIWDLSADQEGNIRTQVSLLSNHFSSVHSDPLLLIFSVSSFKFGLVQLSLLQLGSGPSSRNKLTVSVAACLLRLSSTASRSCPSHRSTPGSRRRTGRSRWLRDCYGRRKHDWVPGTVNMDMRRDEPSQSRLQ